jgi:hypothetical protein
LRPHQCMWLNFWGTLLMTAVAIFYVKVLPIIVCLDKAWELPSFSWHTSLPVVHSLWNDFFLCITCISIYVISEWWWSMQIPGSCRCCVSEVVQQLTLCWLLWWEHLCLQYSCKNIRLYC